MLIRLSMTACCMLLAALVSIRMANAAGHPPVLNVSLQQSEVPSGFKQSAFVLTDDVLASSSGTPAATFASHGRITGIVVTYTRGSFGIRSIVSQYRTSAGAAWEFGVSTAGDLRSLKLVSVPRMGDRSNGLVGQFKAKSGGEILEYGVDVQRGVYDMTAFVVGPPGRISMGQAIHYARLMATRAR